MDYIWQASQAVAEHVPQEELPPMGVDDPSLFLEKDAKHENIRLLALRQRGQAASASTCVC